MCGIDRLYRKREFVMNSLFVYMFMLNTSVKIRALRLSIDWHCAARLILSISEVRGSCGVPRRLSKVTNLLLNPSEYFASIENLKYSV